MKKIRLGIIGVGNIGSAHAQNVLAGKCPEFKLSAVADVSPQRCRWAQETLKVPCFSSAEELLNSGLVDACIVAVPHYDHPAMAIACMERGIHVMVEKPAGVYGKQVEEMNRVADHHPEVVFAVMYNQRTNHIYRKMKELVASGKYGKIRRTNWIVTNWYRSQRYYDSGAWRATWSGEGGGVLMNQCPHQLDLWQWICGMPVKVQAHLHYGKWHQIEVEDDVTAYVEYENGATGVFVASTGDACGTNRFEIQMDGAKLVAEQDTLTLWEYAMPEPVFRSTVKSPFESMKVQEIRVETDGENLQHIGVLNAWGGAILRGEPLVADGREGILGLTLSNGMHLSSWLGQAVTLPLDADFYWQQLQKRIETSKKKANVDPQYADVSDSFQSAELQQKRWNTNW